VCVWGGVSSHRWRGGERAGVFVKPIGRPHISPSRSEVRSPHISPSIRVQGTSTRASLALRVRSLILLLSVFDSAGPSACGLRKTGAYTALRRLWRLSCFVAREGGSGAGLKLLTASLCNGYGTTHLSLEFGLGLLGLRCVLVCAPHLEHLECGHQPHIQGRGAKKRTQRAGWSGSGYGLESPLALGGALRAFFLFVVKFFLFPSAPPSLPRCLS